MTDSAGPQPAIGIETLTDGGQRPADVARGVASFLSQARTSLDLALYDVRFETDAGALVLAALLGAVQRGVAVRLLYNLAHPGPIPVPPPPETAPEAIEALPIETRGIAGIPDLMHHKFVVRDGEAVWGGSTNWTDDSWSRQENVIVTVESREIAYAYSLAFRELWESGTVAHTGNVDPRPVEVGATRVRPWFTPEHGEALSHRIAKHLGKARTRIRIASPVLTSGPILATLVEIVKERRCDLAGIVDDTQIDQVFGQWKTNGVSEWKIPLLRSVLEGAPWSGKVSVPWTPESVHDFMHAKVVAADGLRDRRPTRRVHRPDPRALPRSDRARLIDQGRRRRTHGARTAAPTCARNAYAPITACPQNPNRSLAGFTRSLQREGTE